MLFYSPSLSMVDLFWGTSCRRRPGSGRACFCSIAGLIKKELAPALPPAQDSKACPIAGRLSVPPLSLPAAFPSSPLLSWQNPHCPPALCLLPASLIIASFSWRQIVQPGAAPEGFHPLTNRLLIFCQKGTESGAGRGERINHSSIFIITAWGSFRLAECPTGNWGEREGKSVCGGGISRKTGAGGQLRETPYNTRWT